MRRTGSMVNRSEAGVSNAIFPDDGEADRNGETASEPIFFNEDSWSSGSTFSETGRLADMIRSGDPSRELIGKPCTDADRDEDRLG